MKGDPTGSGVSGAGASTAPSSPKSGVTLGRKTACGVSSSTIRSILQDPTSPGGLTISPGSSVRAASGPRDRVRFSSSPSPPSINAAVSRACSGLHASGRSKSTAPPS